MLSLFDKVKREILRTFFSKSIGRYNEDFDPFLFQRAIPPYIVMIQSECL